MTHVDSDNARRALIAERKRLVHTLTEMGATEAGELISGRDFGDGFADAGAATAERTEVLGLVENLASQVADIDAALGAIADGTYGSCTKCGKEIPPARLEARPMSLLCVDCKNKLG